jgi:hypothetical protein
MKLERSITMKMRKMMVVFCMLFLTSALLVGCGGKKNGDSGTNTKPTDQTTDVVEAKFADVKPTIDGKDNDELWQTIEAKTIMLDAQNTFDMKSSYDNDNVYFLFKWISPEKAPPSLGSWFKKDGKWNWEFISDSFSILWDASQIPDFAAKGCTPLCHQESTDLNHRYMGTANPTDIEEVWEWTPGVTNQKNIMAPYLIVSLPDGVTYEDENFDNKATWEHLPGEYGYHRNRAKDAIAPAEQIVGDKAPFYIINDKPASGDAGMVKATGTYEEPFYILEVARPRTPANTNLLQFNVSDNGWLDTLFGVAIHYKTERDSHKTMALGATYRMVGKNAK